MAVEKPRKSAKFNDFEKELVARPIREIPGLIEFDLPVHGDNRGWFKENYQFAKLRELGLPADFRPVQNNISFNEKRGVTRGMHAEPWNKFISVGNGEVFGAWVDLRPGKTFGHTYSTILTPAKAIYVPEGLANGFQTLTDDTVYTYLVDAHWSPDAKYTMVNAADPALKIKWPISLKQAERSEKDLNHPLLRDVEPIQPKKVMITGAYGQLGSELAKLFPDATKIDRDTLDLTDQAALAKINWREYDLILNAAGYTNVDGAETEQGRRDTWAANATAVRNLALIAKEYNLTLVHISSEYVFDGTREVHTEDEPFAPLGVYAQAKAAAEELMPLLDKYYVLRITWAVGNGKNFVRTMYELANKNIQPKVVNDQIGRLTFMDEVARAAKHLLDTKAAYGTYNLTGDGYSVSFCEIAKEVFALAGHSRDEVTGISTEEYFANATTPISPRPHFSTLNLAKIKATGFVPRDWSEQMKEYVAKLQEEK